MTDLLETARRILSTDTALKQSPVRMHFVGSSSNIKAWGYLPLTRELRVMFRSGQEYRYFGVSRATWNALERATESSSEVSAGEKFVALVRDNPKIRCRKVKP
jgi:hypothetical protein